jgi:hypothetical protein
MGNLSLKMIFLVELVLLELSFGQVVVWSNYLFVELVFVDLVWSSCRLVKLSHIRNFLVCLVIFS